MDIIDLKEYILDNEFVPDVLESIGCHSIKFHDGNPDDYYTCANPDGDNASAITIYLNEYLTCINYTRDMNVPNGVTADIISLVQYVYDMSFFGAFKYICGIVGIDVYFDVQKELPESLQIIKSIEKMNKGNISEDDVPLKVIDEKILSYYKSSVNDMFKDDNIDYVTQNFFEVGYDELTNRITIPIRSEFGDLVGVKGRIFDYEYSGSFKYIYLEKCPRNKILYGLDKTLPFINETKEIIVVESEKAVMQLWSMGFKNAVATGGIKVSKTQIEKIERLGAKIIIAFDKDFTPEKLKSFSDKFLDGIEIYAVIDTENILEEHESPTDNKKKWNVLINNNLFKIK